MKSDLSPGRARLMSLSQDAQFGRIEFSVRAGEPILDSKVRIVRTVKVAGQETRRPLPPSTQNFALRKEWVELFRQLDGLNHDATLIVEINHGLPQFFELSEELRF